MLNRFFSVKLSFITQIKKVITNPGYITYKYGWSRVFRQIQVWMDFKIHQCYFWALAILTFGDPPSPPTLKKIV